MRKNIEKRGPAGDLAEIIDAILDQLEKQE